MTKDKKIKIYDLTDTHQVPSIDVEERVKELSIMLSDPIFSHQHKNIEAVIAMYNTRVTPSSINPWWVIDGVVVKEQPVVEKLPRGTIIFVEQPYYQMMQELSSSPPDDEDIGKPDMEEVESLASDQNEIEDEDGNITASNKGIPRAQVEANVRSDKRLSQNYRRQRVKVDAMIAGLYADGVRYKRKTDEELDDVVDWD
ncbi:MAG: hypothetical protein Q9167_002014 [Letrouitia subvulpina]